MAMGGLLYMKTRYTREGCRVTTVDRVQDNGEFTTEIILETESRENTRSIEEITFAPADDPENTGRFIARH